MRRPIVKPVDSARSRYAHRRQKLVGSRRSTQSLWRLLILTVLAGQNYLWTPPLRAETAPTKQPYSEFLVHLQENRVKRVDIESNGLSAVVELRDGTRMAVDFPGRDSELIKRLRQRQVDINVKAPRQPSPLVQIGSALFLPMLLLGLLVFVLRRVSNGAGGPQTLNFGRSRARFSPEAKTGVIFDDVAGVESAKEELQEVVTFLKEPDRFTAVGAKIPRGVLLVGPPGTGKTLLARAIAGEAGVPFFSLSGSEFVEMFVGVGASRVRDLFQRAKENAPCIVFIDEIDAVGRQRGAGIGGGNDEREQTLNQLLTEMDGFQGNTGVIVIAATNRPDVLDAALLRPGRFDRRILVDYPDYKGRLEILKVHARNKKLDDNVSLETIARRTPGLAGADLASLLNEAAILTARRQKNAIGNLEIADALDRVKVGMPKRPLIDSIEKCKTAYHEVGHALLQTLLPHADPLDKVTIVPRSGGIMGFSATLPDEEVGLETRAKILDMITVALGGRACEEVVFGREEVDDGASSDLQKVTRLARLMVTQLGMTEVGLTAWESPNNEVFLGRDLMPTSEYSEELARRIDRQVRAIAQECYAKAKHILQEHRPLVDRLVEELLEKETLDGDEFRQLVTRYTTIPEKPLVGATFA
ncbi:MAG: ATP-dependent zinc metalloprotease FtsH [Pseudanabaenaceae cyanobacterium]